MPVTKRQFELGVTAECEQVMRSAYQFLAERADYAFTLAEIGDGIIQEQPQEQMARHLERALEVLVGLLAVDQRKLDRGPDVVDYFAMLQEFDTGTWLSLQHRKRQAPPMPAKADS
jgi:hypothetical protein